MTLVKFVHVNCRCDSWFLLEFADGDRVIFRVPAGWEMLVELAILWEFTWRTAPIPE